MKFLFHTSLGLILAANVGGMPHSGVAMAASTNAFRVQQEATSLAKNKVTAVLQKYCGEACELINVDADVDESAGEAEDLGFESISGDAATKVVVTRMAIDIQVDDRVTTADQERLGRLVTNSVKTLTPAATVRWSTVAFPQIGVSAEVEDRLKMNLQQRVHSAVQQTIDSYCPQECVLANVGVDGKLVSPDEARGVPERELSRERGGRGILRIENVDIDLSIDEKLPESNRSKIYNLIKAKTRFAFPVNVNISVVDFPESQASKATQDPWGLDRLRQTLQIFRDLASTKEIITNTTATSNNSNTSSNSSKETQSSERSESKESRENSSTTSKEKTSASEKAISSSSSEKSAEINASEKKSGSENTEYMAYIAGFLILAGIIVAMIMKFASASKDARIMMESMPHSQPRGDMNHQAQQHSGDPNQMGGPANVVAGVVAAAPSRESFSIKMKIEYLREELLKAFMDNPKVTRDTFTRMLQEDGIEQTAKYIHLFGPMIIMDMMNDPNLQRDLHDLSEYYHKATFEFSDAQTLELLSSLKIKVTASEIRVLSRKRSEQFDFLQNLDASQIYALIAEEKPHVQSVILTQLDHNRRRVVFDTYEGQAKVDLMRELCKADAIPKEYLANVAKALHKKVLSRTDFDTEQLRSSDIIIDLLEKASLEDQRALMADLVQTNPEAARAIKLKLVTVEMLPYIKDGHLLEIVMGLEREDLLTFLVAAPEHIRELLLAKAPAELAQSWMEDIEQVTGIDDNRYRLAEMRILARVRNLANGGSIRLLDINERIFSAEQLSKVRRQGSQVEMALSRNSVAA